MSWSAKLRTGHISRCIPWARKLAAQTKVQRIGPQQRGFASQGVLDWSAEPERCNDLVRKINQATGECM